MANFTYCRTFPHTLQTLSLKLTRLAYAYAYAYACIALRMRMRAVKTHLTLNLRRFIMRNLSFDIDFQYRLCLFRGKNTSFTYAFNTTPSPLNKNTEGTIYTATQPTYWFMFFSLSSKAHKDVNTISVYHKIVSP